jgi:hypothetical protein
MSRSASDPPLSEPQPLPGTPIVSKRHLRNLSKASNFGSPPRSPAPPPPYSPAPNRASKEVPLSPVPEAFHDVVPILNMKIHRTQRQAEDRKAWTSANGEAANAKLHIVAKLKMFTISLNDDLVTP